MPCLSEGHVVRVIEQAERTGTGIMIEESTERIGRDERRGGRGVLTTGSVSLRPSHSSLKYCFDPLAEEFPGGTLFVGKFVSPIHPPEFGADNVIEATFANMLLDAE